MVAKDVIGLLPFSWNLYLQILKGAESQECQNPSEPSQREKGSVARYFLDRRHSAQVEFLLACDGQPEQSIAWCLREMPCCFLSGPEVANAIAKHAGMSWDRRIEWPDEWPELISPVPSSGRCGLIVCFIRKLLNSCSRFEI